MQVLVKILQGTYKQSGVVMDQCDVWNNIAEDWHKFRETPIREAAEFLANKKGLILDIGCGSGRNFARISGTIIGADFSERMLRFASTNARKSGMQIPLVISDATELPFADDSFDSVICAATLHCIKYNKHGRVLTEIVRVAKKGAPVFVSVWNRDQPRFAGAKRESYIPWKSGLTYQRYYYLYSNDELEAAMKKHFTSVRVFGGADKAFKRYSKNIIAVARVAKSGQRRK